MPPPTWRARATSSALLRTILTRPGNARRTARPRPVARLPRRTAVTLLGLTRLAFIMLGDRQAAEDVVQEAFCGLYRVWNRLPDHGNVHGYLRVSVLNGCRWRCLMAEFSTAPEG